MPNIPERIATLVHCARCTADGSYCGIPCPPFEGCVVGVEAYGQQCRAEEREACAEVADDVMGNCMILRERIVAGNISVLIRARKDETP